MRVKYVGGHDEVVIDATGQVCKRDATVEVDDRLGKRLLEQKSNWQPVKATTPKGKESSDGTA